MTAIDTVTIRRAGSADAGALDRLAGLDSKRLPHDDFLIAEVDGEPRAARGIRSGAVVANPFRPTADLADLLRLRAERARGAPAGSGAAPRPLSPARPA